MCCEYAPVPENEGMIKNQQNIATCACSWIKQARTVSICKELTRVYVEQFSLKHDEILENADAVCRNAIIKGTLQQTEGDQRPAHNSRDCTYGSAILVVVSSSWCF